MSLGADTIVSSVDNAIIAAHAQGILVVVAAGNVDRPVTGSPAHVNEAITVGMTEPDRSRVSRIKGVWGSNYGRKFTQSSSEAQELC